MTLIKRHCNLTGREEEMDIPKVTQEEVDGWLSMGSNRPHVQHQFPNHTPDEREFILSGITPDLWDELVAPDEGDAYKDFY